MKVQVKLFASAREKAGSDVAELDVASPASVQDLLTALRAVYPDLRPVSGRWAVNLDFVALEHPVTSDDEVAFIPPVSGG
jgi:molybdopterin converting factor subunit 1